MEDDPGGRIETPKKPSNSIPKNCALENDEIQDPTCKSQKGLEDTLTAGAHKGEATIWSFRTFKEQQRNLFGSVESDKIQGRHEWALEKLKEEVIHPSVEPEEVIKVIDEFRDDQQEENDDVLSEISVGDVSDAKVWTNQPIVNFLKKPRESLLIEDDVVEYINECRVRCSRRWEYTEQYDSNA
ncbi:hypothetical protein RhiirA4_487190 [Rhizophagus irregularis]|uniref:Uncharacterized protein n=1 Tax=Rhizophagus irregularis TaxID=588596 RepID=A0A2I1HSA3_9GLOM|nr:hypothetical protein RhiirA4_487190 [Rhizophagus irregularis]